MIERGQGWKFQAHRGETSLFEEQVVEHMVTGGIAHRRAYGEAPSRDAEFMEAVKRQIEAMAEIEHPALQRIYLTEEVVRHFCVIGELIEGETLSSLTIQKKFANRTVWAETALKIVRMLEDFEDLGVAFDRLELENLVLRRDLLRVNTRFPVGCLKPGQDPGEGFLKRAEELMTGGVYLAEHAYPAPAGKRKLKNLLYSMAMGHPNRSVEQAIEAARRNEKESEKRILSILGLDQKTERVFLGLHGDPSVTPITTLAELREALIPMCPDRIAVAISPRTKLETPDRPIVATPTAEDSPLPVASPTPAPLTPLPYRGPSSIPMVGSAGMDLDVEEDRSYLYPGKPGAAKAAMGEATSQGSTPKPTTRKRLPIMGLLVALLAVLVLAGGIIGLVMLVQGKFTPPPNHPPVAGFAPIPDSVRQNVAVRLDGSSSEDPDGSELSYTWRVVELPAGQATHRIQPNANRSAREAELRIFQPGVYTIELRVYDGAQFSEPVSRQIEILP